jgi:hypothetical protein
MNRNYATTDYNDSQLFIHDNRDTDIIDFMPPTSKIGWNAIIGSFDRYSISDDNYQAIHDEMADEQNIVAYGEGHDGAAKHAMEMTGLDRMIYEDCNNGSNKIQRKSANIPQIARHHRIEWLEQRIEDADLADCRVLAECFRTLDATLEMITQFIGWLNKGDLDAGIEYFTNLAYNLAELEAPTAAAVDMDSEIESAYNPDCMIDYELWAERNTFADGQVEECHMPDAKEFAYTTINTDLGDDDWMDKQSPWFRKLMDRVPKINNYMILKRLGSGIWKKQQSGKLSSEQAWVFWSSYKIRKAKLRARVIKKQPAVSVLLTRLRNSKPSQIRFIGFWLYDQQTAGGKTEAWSSTKTMDEQGWSIAWEQYHELKANSQGAQASAKLAQYIG